MDNLYYYINNIL